MPDTDMESADPETTVYSQNGDLILVVGEEAKQRRIQIDSKVLVPCSPVFAAMLGPNFSEGHRLREKKKGAPMELALPGDDPTAVKHMCAVLYERLEEVRAVKPRELYQVAIVVDKYDLVARFRFISFYWLGDFKDQAIVPKACWHLMVAAYFFAQPTHFSYYSRQATQVYQSARIYLELAERMEDHSLGLCLCLALEHSRPEARAYSQTRFRGLCLHCFKKTKKYPRDGSKEPDCPTPEYH